MIATKYETKIGNDGLIVCEKIWSKRINICVEKNQFRHPEDIYKLCKALNFDSYSEEHVFLLIFDIKMHFKSFIEIGIGSNDRCVIDRRGIAQKVLMLNAGCFVIVHNHTSGDAAPSKEDVEISKAISELGKIIGIPLKDSIVLGSDRIYSSMKENGVI